MSNHIRSIGYWVLAVTVGVGIQVAAQAAPGENSFPSSNSVRLNRAYDLLAKSASGKAILETAQKQHISIKDGRVSKTEMTATRTTDGTRESYKYSVQVLIARDKEPIFQALDLAHELTHATHPNSNPFDPNLNAQEYVRHGIESEGGEAQAILQECVVGKELLTSVPEETAQLVKARCQFVWKNENDDAKWKQSFYQLGKHYHDFVQMVGMLQIDPEQKSEWTKRVENRSPMFASAVTHKPYPLALLEEYVQVTQKICEKFTRGVDRKVASAASVITALSNRCQAVQNIP